MVNILTNKLETLANKCIIEFAKPFFGYQIGQKLPFLKNLYKFFYESSKPKMVKVFGQWLILHPDDQIFSNEIISTGVFEELEVSIFLSLLEEGMTVFDIGANVGYYTLIAASKIGSYGRVYAFEPDKDNFNILQKNVALNKHSNVELLEYAVSDENSDLALSLSPDNKGDHRTYKNNNFNKEKIHYTVKGIQLDSYFEGLNVYPNIIKMDIQGFEYFALKGMKNLIIENPNVVLLTEFWPFGLKASGLESPVLFYNQLEELGFEIFKIDDLNRKVEKVIDINLLLASLTGESFTNLLCLKGEAIKNRYQS
ncbi:FkbM family methyltransferase [Nostoc sp. JL33]|uniref:FkbM family methyltransferase n=1 Tax=Nostoc sp. JL33 TaxID=2815396 RepID=UPI0025E05F41|nr:FkbM family methyltransferase [Nostoc sp. JL33]MBN3870641.1 FkbM family methyltransferase [Nostoc sp. JL33]